jgi:hypothetical protein
MASSTSEDGLEVHGPAGALVPQARTPLPGFESLGHQYVVAELT